MMNSNMSELLKSSSQKLEVKNKTPAPVQITAEQLLLEAVQRQADEVKQPTLMVVDEDELQSYRVRKRKEFEDILRRQRHHMGTWVKYALWEAAQKEFRRARSIFERALQLDYQNVKIWQKYLEMETKNKFINSARNLYDRVCQLLPRVDQFWFKYAHMEELLGNYAGARSIFERWMEWNPDDKAWMMFIRFEERCSELGNCRKIFERYLSANPSQGTFLKFCKFEEKHGNIIRTRAGFEKAIELLPADMLTEDFYIKFAKFEGRQMEHERAEAIYRQALARLPEEEAENLYTNFVSFQKQHGDKDSLEETVLNKRRKLYEEELKNAPQQYDVWFDYIRLEENAGNVDKIREIYERAISNVPPVLEKKYWKRYIYLWINYVLFEELRASELERCRTIYSRLLGIIPHKLFSFTKIWQLYAEFEIRRGNLDMARKILGNAMVECNTEKIYKNYSSLELRLGNIDRCRKILAKFVESHPHNPKSWTALIELELMADEIERARAIAELAIDMEQMDTPELIWKVYIDMETDRGELSRARLLYERLLDRTQHFKVYRSYSVFESKHADSMETARRVLERGLTHCKEHDLNEERALLLEHWMQLERERGDAESIEKIFKRQPKKVKKRKQLVDADGEEQGWEEYITYIFPDDGIKTANLKILEAARAWKKQQALQEVA